MLRGTREIKIHAIEDRVSETFDDQIERIRYQSQELTLQQQIETFKAEAVQYMGITLIYCSGAYFCVTGSLTVGEFFAFITSVNLLMGPLMMLFQLNLAKANAEAGLERIMRVLHTETSIEEPPPGRRVEFARREEIARASGLPFVEFRGVSFAYGDTPVLRNVSCTVGHGETVALVGPSGSGKTTFVRLALRLYDPQSGTISVNGEDIRSYSLHDIRSAFGVVSQDTFLFQATIAENIRVAEPQATTEQVRQAMETAYVSEFVDTLPAGEQTQVGEAGYSLSGGQKQRIAIARAVLGNQRAFIFDEATSALDNHSEKRIQQAMTQLRCGNTMVIIAHRLSTVKDADRILVFDKGEIVQEGTYDTLAARPGLFQNLLRHGL
jgi:ABC-type multidrug transport system fused ATPase/permease subunit